jgi:hypothetical protein
MKNLLAVIGVFLLVFLIFTAIGYLFFLNLSFPTNTIVMLLLSHLGLLFGIYFARKVL